MLEWFMKKKQKQSGINVSLIPIAVRRFERARHGKNPCDGHSPSFIATAPRPQSDWSKLLSNLKAFGESLKRR